MDTYTCEFGKLNADTEYKYEVCAVYQTHKGQSITGFLKTPSTQNRKGITPISKYVLDKGKQISKLYWMGKITYFNTFAMLS